MRTNARAGMSKRREEEREKARLAEKDEEEAQSDEVTQQDQARILERPCSPGGAAGSTPGRARVNMSGPTGNATFYGVNGTTRNGSPPNGTSSGHNGEVKYPGVPANGGASGSLPLGPLDGNGRLTKLEQRIVKEPEVHPITHPMTRSLAIRTHTSHRTQGSITRCFPCGW